jgi:hypothetical protein
MHFMLLVFAFVLGAVLWGFFHSNPQGVGRGALLACNAAVMLLAVGAALASGLLLYADASVVKAHEKGLALYLSGMAGGTAFLIVVASGGLLRNLLIFPLSRRTVTPRTN